MSKLSIREELRPFVALLQYRFQSVSLKIQHATSLT